jgi:hypothetical protein
MNPFLDKNTPQDDRERQPSWFRTDFLENLPERWLKTDSPEKPPARGLTRSNAIRGFTLDPKDKRRRWNIQLRRTQKRLFSKNKNKNEIDIDTAIVDDETEDSSSVVTNSLIEALAELDELDDQKALLNEHASLRHLITETLSDPDTYKQLNLIASKDQLRYKIHKDYTEVLLDHASPDQCDVQVKLHAASHLIQEFVAGQVQQLIRSTIMPDTIQEVIFRAVEDYIQPLIADLYSDIDDVTPADAAKIISWVDNFLATMDRQCPLLEPLPSWRADCELLVEHYLNRGVRREMKELVQRSLDFRSDLDVREQPNGLLVTGYSDQIGYLCDIQLKVAQELLPPQYTERVLTVCNEELLVMVCDLMFQVEANWKAMSSSRFCAIINEASLLSEQCGDRNSLFLSNPEYLHAGDELTRELAEVSLHATRYLCERIMLDLQEPEPILTRVGDADWESDETGSAVVRTIATLKDFFLDLERWLISDYFFPKVLKNCLDLTLQIYMESFFSNTMHHGVSDPDAASYELNQDYLRLVNFFNGDTFTKYIGAAGFYEEQEINSRLGILRSLSILLNPAQPPDGILQEIKSILVQLCGGGEHGVPAVLHLVGLRKRHSENEAIKWLKAISQANKMMRNDANPVVSPSYRVPDLRNSRYIHNIQLTRRKMVRELSDGDRSVAEITYKLARTRAPTHVDLAVTATRRMITNVLTRR